MLEPFALVRLLGNSRARLAAVLPVLLLGCASGPAPRPAALDPSNPNNPESPFVAKADVSASETAPPGKNEPPPGSMPGMDMSAGGMSMPSGPMSGSDAGAPMSSATDAGATVFTCPMHPEVRQPGPGQCPKCGMTLVPAAPAAPAPSMQHGANDGGR